MITLAQYVGCWAGSADWTPECQRNAKILLEKVNALLADYTAKTNTYINLNPKTKSEVSGETGGGFRPQDYPVGASKSSHKVGMGVDIYDYNDKFKMWLMKNQDFLIKHELYMENPTATDSWVHLQTRATRNRVFMP